MLTESIGNTWADVIQKNNVVVSRVKDTQQNNVVSSVKDTQQNNVVSSVKDA